MHALHECTRDIHVCMPRDGCSGLRLRGGGVSPWASLLSKQLPLSSIAENGGDTPVGLCAVLAFRIRKGTAIAFAAVSAAVSSCFGTGSGMNKSYTQIKHSFSLDESNDGGSVSAQPMYASLAPLTLKHSLSDAAMDAKESTMPAFEVLLDWYSPPPVYRLVFPSPSLLALLEQKYKY